MSKKPTALYRKIIRELEARRIQLQWSCERLDQAAGLSDRYWMKLVHCDAPSGRVGQWEILDLVSQALYPQEFEVLVIGMEANAKDVAKQRRGEYA